MEGNLVAEVFAAEEKIRACVSLTPPVEPFADPSTASCSQQVQPSSSAVQRRHSSGERQQSERRIASPSDDIGEGIVVSVVSTVQRESGGILTRKKFVVYGLRSTRFADGTEHTVYRRFREIKALYYQLLSDLPDLEFNNVIKFPSSEDNWLSSKQSSDPNHPIVLKRRHEIQAFFFELLKYYPKLIYHPKFIDFFELHAFSSLAASSFSTRLQDVRENPSGSALGSSSSAVVGDGIPEAAPRSWLYAQDGEQGGEYDPVRGEFTKAGSWQVANSKPSLSFVEFSKFNEWYHSRTQAPE